MSCAVVLRHKIIPESQICQMDSPTITKSFFQTVIKPYGRMKPHTKPSPKRRANNMIERWFYDGFCSCNDDFDEIVEAYKGEEAEASNP